MAIIMDKGKGNYLAGVMFSPSSDLLEGTLDNTVQKALRYAGEGGHLASMPELLHASTLSPSTSEIWTETRIVANSEEYVGKTKGGKPIVLVVHGGGIFFNDMKRLTEVKRNRWSSYSKQIHENPNLELHTIGTENHVVSQWAYALMEGGSLKPSDFSMLDQFVIGSNISGKTEVGKEEAEYMRQQLRDGMGKPGEKEFAELLNGNLPDGKAFPAYSYSEIRRGVSDMPKHYGIILDYDKAKKTPSGYVPIGKLAENPLFIARGGGNQDAVARYLDDVKGRLKTDHYGNWHLLDVVSPDKLHAYPLMLGRMNQDTRTALVTRQLFEGIVGVGFPDYGSVVAVQSQARQDASLLPPLENLLGGGPRYVPKELRMQYFARIDAMRKEK